MDTEKLTKMIADEVTRAIAPLHERLDRIETGRQPEPFDFQACYEKSGRIKKQQ